MKNVTQYLLENSIVLFAISDWFQLRFNRIFSPDEDYYAQDWLNRFSDYEYALTKMDIESLDIWKNIIISKYSESELFLNYIKDFKFTE